MYKNLRLMCLVSLLVPILVLMRLAAVESVCKNNVVLSDSPDYCKKFDMPGDSAVPLPIAIVRLRLS